MEIAVIGDSDTVLGFSLAGIKKTFKIDDSNTSEAKSALKNIKNFSNVAILIITEKVAELIRKELNEWQNEKGIYPVIMEIPDRTGPISDKDSLSELIKKAIGLDMVEDKKV